MSELDRLSDENSVLIQVITPTIPMWAIYDWFCEEISEGELSGSAFLNEYLFRPVIAIEVWKDLHDSKTWYDSVIFGSHEHAIGGKEESDCPVIREKAGKDYRLMKIGYTTDKDSPIPEDGWGDIEIQHFIEF